MKIFVAGASGRVGTALIKNLVKDGHQVIAAARHPEKIVRDDHITPIKLDLHHSTAELADDLRSVDIVYFTAGSRGKDLLQTDAFGAVKLMQAAKENGVKRFVMLSSMFALEPDKWQTVKSLAEITDYNIAKYFADNYLVHDSGLNYTIIQPSLLSEKAGTGNITVGDKEYNEIAIDDVALTLADVLKHDNTINHVIKIHAGDQPVDDALANV